MSMYTLAQNFAARRTVVYGVDEGSIFVVLLTPTPDIDFAFHSQVQAQLTGLRISVTALRVSMSHKTASHSISVFFINLVYVPRVGSTRKTDTSPDAFRMLVGESERLSSLQVAIAYQGGVTSPLADHNLITGELVGNWRDQVCRELGMPRIGYAATNSMYISLH
jgi:hypothetical protein